MKALIDGDIVCYRSAASAEKDDQEIALIRASRTLQDIVSITDATSVEVFLSGTANFRKDIYPEYKANRLTLPKPKHLNAVKEFLILQWGAEVTDGYEADDALGIALNRDTGGGVCVSIDKDMLQLPGLHLNFVSGEFREIDVIEGWRNFYYQTILGDRGDNVPGYDGKMRPKWPNFLLPIKAALDGCTTKEAMYQVVKEVYENEETLIRNARLLYIWRVVNDQWQPPQLNSLEEKQETAEKSVSTTTLPVEITQSMEPIITKPKSDGFRSRGPKRATLSRRRSRVRLT